MKQFKVIPQLTLVEGKLMCKKPSGRSYQKAHFKQGDLDGACGAYSIAMALNILGVFEADNIYSDKEFDKRTAEWKLINALNEQGLYREGLTANQIQTILQDNYSKYVTVLCAHKDDHNLFDLLRKWIDDEEPCLIGIEYNKSDGHWIVAVGYALDENGEVTDILTLDPGVDSPKCAMWNGILNVNKIPRKTFGYSYTSDKTTLVDVTEAIVIHHK